MIALRDTSTTVSRYIDKKVKITCFYCRSESITKYGSRYCRKGSVQIYFCKSCSRRFTPKDGFRRMKHDKKTITAALDCYAKGMSLRGVQHHLKMFYDKEISHVAILYWIRQYGKLLKGYSETLKPKTSKKWYADETALHFNNRKNWLWCTMDSRTRFWIANETSLWKNEYGCKRLFDKAITVPIETPDVIATDGAMCYTKTIKTVFTNTEHVRYTKPEQKHEMQIMERLNGNIKQRTKVMRGMYCLRTAKQLMDFWQVYYYFVRPHQALNGATPADFAGVGNLKGNKWDNLIKNASEAV